MIEVSTDLVASVGAAFIAGVSASAHCIAMCGGISLCLQKSTANPIQLISPHQSLTTTARLSADLMTRFRPLLTLSPHLIRITTYALLAFLVYLISGHDFLSTHAESGAPRWLLGLGLVGAGVYNLWVMRHPCLGCQTHRATLATEIPRWMRWFWGLLPCPIVITMLIASRGTNSAIHAALFMFCFGLGTLPALIGFTWGAQQTFRTVSHSSKNRSWYNLLASGQRAFTVILLLGGIWTLSSEWLMSHHHHQHHHHHALSAASRTMEDAADTLYHHTQHHFQKGSVHTSIARKTGKSQYQYESVDT
ncbi:MAG: sulfite exporter TauE/SafE family protein [Gammaproteobacteria bacterium]